MAAKILVIWNNNASGGDGAEALHQELTRRDDVMLREPADPEQMAELIRREGPRVERIVAAGGDGTVHNVINILHEAQCHTPLAIVPLGTANDLSRTLAIPLDPQLAFALADGGGIVRSIDLARIRGARRTAVFANIATGGNSEKIQEHITPEMKQTWGPLCYLRGAIEVLRDLEGFRATIQLDDEPAFELSLWNISLANGRTGGSITIAPLANPEDGLLEVVLVLDGTATDLASTAASFFVGDFLKHEQVMYRRASRVKMSVDPPLAFSADGELLEDGPFEFEVLPRALEAIVGPDYSAEVSQ